MLRINIVEYYKVECCYDKVERCFDIVAGVGIEQSIGPSSGMECRVIFLVVSSDVVDNSVIPVLSSLSAGCESQRILVNLFTAMNNDSDKSNDTKLVPCVFCV